MTLAQRLLRWYDKNGRDLPWRHTRDPYRILVSEIMLQQTQVSRGLLYYEKWLKRFPTWKSLAAASNADVIHEWAGLGYNRRALMLRDIAKQVVERGVPKTESEWLELKGIGPYTAAALAAFSLKKRTLPIDTNIRRVLGRLLLGIPYPQPTVDERLRKASEGFLPRSGRFYDVPQALFDFATMQCTKVPACATCPLRDVCPAGKKFLSGRVRVPTAMIKKAIESKHRDKPYPDRIYRGRILKLVRENPGIRLPQVGKHIDPTFDAKQDAEWVLAMVARMKTDGFLRVDNGRLFV